MNPRRHIPGTGTGPTPGPRPPARIALSVDPYKGSPLGAASDRRFRATVSLEVELYNTAVDAERWAEARDRAATLAVRLEGRDHPQALTWWQRHHECERLATEASGGMR